MSTYDLHTTTSINIEKSSYNPSTGKLSIVVKVYWGDYVTSGKVGYTVFGTLIR